MRRALAVMRWLRMLCSVSVRRTAFVPVTGRARLLVIPLAFACAVPVTVASPTRAPAPLPAADYSRLEAQVLAALNRARTDPQGTAADLDALTRYYNGKLLQRPTQSVPIQTVEGVSAAREAVSAVRSEAPVASLTLSVELS